MRVKINKQADRKRLADFGIDFAKALEYLTAVVRRDKTDALAYAERAIAHFNLKNYLEGKKDIARALRKAPNDSGVRFLVGYAVYILLHKPFEAINYFDAAIRLDSRNAEAYAWRSRIWADKDQHALALEDIDKAIAFKSDSAVYHRFRAVDLFNLGLFEKSVQAYDRAIVCEPAASHLYFQRAEIYMAMDEPAKAYADLKEVRRLDATPTGDTHYLIGLAMERLGKKKAAMAHYGDVTGRFHSSALSRSDNLEQGRDGRSKAKAFDGFIKGPYKNFGSVEIWLSELHGMWNVMWFMNDYTCVYQKESGKGHIIVKISTRAGRVYSYWFMIEGKR